MVKLEYMLMLQDTIIWTGFKLLSIGIDGRLLGKTIIPSGSKNGKEFLVYLSRREIKPGQVYSQ
jgi:hypothetical protein